MGERRVKVQPSPANADEQGIVKGEGCICKIEKQVLGKIYRLTIFYTFCISCYHLYCPDEA